MSNRFVIEHKDNPKLNWNECGEWVNIEQDDNYTVYTLEEAESENLPENGKWEQI
jgi:hypothetical protein